MSYSEAVSLSRAFETIPSGETVGLRYVDVVGDGAGGFAVVTWYRRIDGYTTRRYSETGIERI